MHGSSKKAMAKMLRDSIATRISNIVSAVLLLYCFQPFQIASLADQKISRDKAAGLDSLMLLVDLGHHQEALSVYESLSPDDKKTPQSVLLSARIYTGLGQLRTAKEKFVEYISLKPGDNRPYLGLGLISGREGNFKEAILMFEKAINIDPRSAKAYSDRGVARGAIGKTKESVKDFDRAISLDPRYADAYRNRGIARDLLGDAVGACADWRAAAALGQDDPARWVRNQCK